MINPTGKKHAEIVFMRPGAFSWNHGDALVEMLIAHPNPRRKLPATQLTNILSRRWRAFLLAMLEISNVVCAGVKASILINPEVLRDDEVWVQRAV
jgi:hypothetical protein